MAKGGRSYADKDLKLLFGLSAGRCARCRVECVLEASGHDANVIVAEIAHIVAFGKTGPRADLTYPKELLNKYDNLILLCPNDHTKIDGQPNTYTIGDLRKWKSDHEKWVRDNLSSAMPSIGFAELEVVTKALVNVKLDPAETFELTEPTMKLQRNGLSDSIRFLVTLGLAKAREVEKFVSHVAAIDPYFPEKLKSGFVDQYLLAKKNGLDGDGIFEGLVQFASGGSHDFQRQAAGLAVLAYLFEKCEVFEP